MLFSHSTRRWTAWITLWSMVWGAVLPLAAHAVVVPFAAGHTVEICSATGIARVAADLPANGPDGSAGLDFSQHCPWCNLHGGVAGLPPQSQGFVTAALPAVFTGGYHASASVAPPWHPGTPRAPPRG